MAVIIDPDNLNQNTEVSIITSSLTISLQIAGNLSTDGVTLQCLYSFLKEEWKIDSNLIKFPFPMGAITEEKFELISGWDFADTTTKQLIRNGGWALKDANGTSQEEYAGIITLGDVGVSDQIYYQQISGGSASNIVRTGAVNQAVQVYGDASHGNFDRRAYFKIFVREYQKSYALSQLSDIGVTTMTYQVYRFPLANSTDLKIVSNDASMTTSPYSGMSITWYNSAQPRTIGGISRNFHIIINGSGGTAEQIYTFTQNRLRQNSDIDSGSGVQNGKVNSELLRFVGDNLSTLYQTEGGVYIDNFLAADTNRLTFADDTNTNRTFPYVASLSLQFGDNLKNDAAAIYRIFFTNDDAGNNTGRDFGTTSAITVLDNSSVVMSGLVSNQSSVSFTYDYDGNVQRGALSAGVDAPITVVGIGLSTAQYVVATGTIQRSTSNTVSLVSGLERNYNNS